MITDRSIVVAIGGLVALAAAMGIGRFVYTPILPVMADALGWTKADAGLVASANYLGYFLGAIVAAQSWIAARARLSLLTALALSAATTTAMAMSVPIVGHLGLRLVGGFASAIVIVCASSLVLARLTRAGRGGLTSLHFAGVGTGIVVSAVAVSGLLATGGDWSALWLAAGGLSVVALLPAMIMIPSDDTAASAAPAGPPAAATAPIGPMILAHGLFGIGYVITTTFIVALVRLSPDLRSLEPVIWIVVGLAAIPSVAIWVGLAGRIGVMPAYALACLVEAVSVAMSVEWSTMTGLMVSAVLLGGTFMGITTLGFLAARNLGGTRPQQAMGRMTASFAVGQMIGPVLAGWMFERLGDFRAASLLAAAGLVVAMALALLTRHLEVRQAARR